MPLGDTTFHLQSRQLPRQIRMDSIPIAPVFGPDRAICKRVTARQEQQVKTR